MDPFLENKHQKLQHMMHMENHDGELCQLFHVFLSPAGMVLPATSQRRHLSKHVAMSFADLRKINCPSDQKRIVTSVRLVYMILLKELKPV